jgi:hypothetical protein
MSTVPSSNADPSQIPPAPPGAVPVYEVPRPGTPAQKKIDYIIVYGHSNLLYWWPVWLVSFILAGVTYMEGDQMAVVPPRTEVRHGALVEGYDQPRDVLVAPPGREFVADAGEGRPTIPGMTVSRNNSLGVIFVATLVAVALASTILLRGLVSLIAVIVMIALVITFALFGWWNDILAFIGGLDIRMNAAGYLAVGIPLFLAWVAVIFVYDRAHYVVFDQGQIRYVLEVGDNEVVMQSEGAVVEKKRNDVFRHWLLGFGTGDLVIRTGGAHGQAIELENVLGINRKLVVINQMVKEKAVTVEA